MVGDELRQRFETLKLRCCRWPSPCRRRDPAAGAAPPADRPCRRAGAGGAGWRLGGPGRPDGRPRPWVGPVAPVPTTQPAPMPPTTAAPPPSAVPPTTIERPPTTTTAPSTTAAAAAQVELRPDGLGVVGFGTGEREALDRLERRLRAPTSMAPGRGRRLRDLPGPGPGGRTGSALRAVHQRAHPVRGRRALAPVHLPGGRCPADRGRPRLQRPHAAARSPAAAGASPGPLPASASAPPWPSCAAPMADACRSASANPQWCTGSGRLRRRQELSGSPRRRHPQRDHHLPRRRRALRRVGRPHPGHSGMTAGNDRPAGRMHERV